MARIIILRILCLALCLSVLCVCASTYDKDCESNHSGFKYMLTFESTGESKEEEEMALGAKGDHFCFVHKL